ncbi:NLRC3 [Symbiodinium microadriaticum]|nr:NLRC3 [Symbiodinium microadriaticum]
MCRRYLSFVTHTTDKTLEDYFALFRRLAMVDLLLVVAYGVLVGISISLMVGDADEDSFVRMLLLVLGVCVVVIWLCDAALVTHFGFRVREAATSDSVHPDNVKDLIQRKRLCLVVSSLGLAVYVARFCVELWQAREQGLLETMSLPTVILALVLLVKVLRLLALNSFSNWVRMTAGTSSVCVTAFEDIESLQRTLFRGNLAKVVAVNKVLRSLNLSGNLFDEAAAAAWAIVLRGNCELKQLHLNGCHLNDSAGIHLANSLLENEGLEVLSMRDNSIRDASASAFAEALHHNGTVTQLNLELNSIDFHHLLKIKQLARLMQMPNEFWRSCVRVLYADQDIQKELPAADDIVEVYMMPVNRNMGTSGVMSQDDCVFQILSGSREKVSCDCGRPQIHIGSKKASLQDFRTLVRKLHEVLFDV